MVFAGLILPVFLSCRPLHTGSGSEPRLAECIARKSGITIEPAGGDEWESHELQAVDKLLDLLPEEYKTLKPITLVKGVAPPTEREPFYRVSFRNREITLLRPAFEKEQIQRILLRVLTRFLDRERSISESWQWRKISRWTGWDILGNSAQNKNPQGFALPEGRKNPAADLVATAEMFFLPPVHEDTMQYLKCRLPSKYRFFRELFRSKPDPQGCIRCKETYRDWIDPEEVDQIELLIASPSYVSVASIAGHMLLLIRRRGDITGLSTVVGFVADSISPEGVEDHGFTYAFKGIFGLYDSLVQEETLTSVVARYTQRENRDLYRLKINFTRPQLRRFIERLWEIKRTFTYRYYFFNLNCTTMMLNLINDVLPKGEQIKDRDFMDLPLNIGSKVFCKGAVEFVYPEYWSLSRQARYSSSKNRAIGKHFVRFIHRDFGSAAARRMKNYINKSFSKREKNRAQYYEKMSTLYLELHERLKLSLAVKKEYYRQGKLLLRFLMNAKNRETYIYARAIKRNPEKQGEERPLFLSPENAVLIKQIFKLRYFLKPYLPGEVNALHREIREEMMGYTREMRRRASYNCDYSQIRLSPRVFRVNNGVSYAGPSAAYAAFFQEMGSGSVFSLGEDTHLELMCLALRYSAPLSRNSSDTRWDKDFKLLKYEKIITGRSVDYHGWLNPGFGITMLDRRSLKRQGIMQDVNYLNLRFILNIFEKNRFAHFLNLSFGAGYSYRDDLEGHREHFLDFLFRLNGQFYLFGSRRNALRFALSYRPRFNIASGSLGEWRARLETRWGVGRYANALLSVGISAERDQFHSVMGSPPAVERLTLYTTFRFKGLFVTRWIDFRKLLNRVF